MDAHFYRHLVQELVPRLLNQRIQSIYSPAPKIFTLKFGAGVFLIVGTNQVGPFLFLTDTKPDNPAVPWSEVMRLRKLVVNRRIVSAMACWPRRQIALGLSPGQSRFLILDFEDGLSLRDDVPSDFLDEPMWPSLAEIQGSSDIWQQYPQLSPRVRAEMQALPENDRLSWYTRLQAGTAQGFFTFLSSPTRMEALPWKPYKTPLLTEPLREFETALEASAFMGAWFLGRRLNRSAEHQVDLNRHRRKLQKVLIRLDQDQKRLEEMVDAVWMGNMLQSNLYALDRTAKMDSLRLPTSDGQERDILLDNRLTVLENMERIFKQAAKGRRGLTHLARRRAEVMTELEQPVVPGEAIGTRRQIAKAHVQPLGSSARQKNALAVHRFRTSDGFIVVRGKNKAANHKLLSQVAKAHDYWFHAADGPGAHVVLKRDSDVQDVPEQSLIEAAALAGLASFYKDAGKARVICAKVKDVRKVKGFDLGQVLVERVWRTFDVELPPDLEDRLLASR